MSLPPDPLLDALVTIIEAVEQKHGHAEALLIAASISHPQLMFNALRELQELANPLMPLLTAHPDFPGTTQLMITTDTASFGFYPYMATHAMVQRVLRTRDPEGTIEWLKNILKTREAVSYAISILWNTPVESVIRLTDTVSVVPIEQLPESGHKRWLRDLPVNAMFSPFAPTLFTQATAALITRIPPQPFLTPASTGGNLDPVAERRFAESSLRNALFDDITLGLTLVGPRPAFRLTGWTTFDDPDLEEVSRGGGRNILTEEVLPTTHAVYPALDEQLAPRIVQGFLALSGRTKDKIRIGLSRLNQALRRQQFGDRAVDLVTALEAVTSDGETNELAHKVTVRTVRLVGGSEDERRRNSTILKRTYDIRSKLLHTGTFPSKSIRVGSKTLMPADIVNEATKLCAVTVIKLIERGSIPDWHHFDIAADTQVD